MKPSDAPDTFATRLARATNTHDVEQVVDCFTTDYVNRTPTHPARGFEGREQVRRNWTQIFAAVPDITAEVLGTAQSGEETWSEWEMRGHRTDGTEHLMRGVIIFGVDTDDRSRAHTARFYLEPVDPQDLDADSAVRQVLDGGTP